MVAAAAAGTPGPGASSMPTTSLFAAARDSLGQYVIAAERTQPAVPVPVRALPLMPGADVDACYDPDDDHEQRPREAGPAAPAQLTIVYGGRVLVLDGVPAGKAPTLLRLAATAARGGKGTAVEPQPSGGDDACGWWISSAAADLPVARKASLQRFMEKRKDRAADPLKLSISDR